jgi:hypothetical protein
MLPSSSVPGNPKISRQSQIHFPVAQTDIGRPGPAEAETSTAASALEINSLRNPVLLSSTAGVQARQRRQSAEGLRVRSRTLPSAAVFDSRHGPWSQLHRNQEKAQGSVTRMAEEEYGPVGFSDEYDLCEFPLSG